MKMFPSPRSMNCGNKGMMCKMSIEQDRRVYLIQNFGQEHNESIAC